jgi:hemolysin III
MATITNNFGYSSAEEVANALTHGLGFLLALAGLVLITTYSALYGNVWHIVSSIIFASSMVLLYGVSTFYHSVSNIKVKKILQQLDHTAIFLLIAGSYTPFTLVTLQGTVGWVLLSSVWLLALVGVIFQYSILKKYEKIRIALYLLMGWLIIFAIQPLSESLATGGLVLLVLGGLSYSVGVIFYLWDKLKFNHAIWHSFVLAGTAFHFFAVFIYVIPHAGAS